LTDYPVASSVSWDATWKKKQQSEIKEIKAWGEEGHEASCFISRIMEDSGIIRLWHIKDIS